jgi:hydrogenase expression/formation protein HypC
MCMAIPARVIQIEEGAALVDTGTQHRRVGSLFVPETKAGDWVLVSTGQIVSRLTPEEAEATLELLAELRAFEAKENARQDPSG